MATSGFGVLTVHIRSPSDVYTPSALAWPHFFAPFITPFSRASSSCARGAQWRACARALPFFCGFALCSAGSEVDDSGSRFDGIFRDPRQGCAASPRELSDPFAKLGFDLTLFVGAGYTGTTSAKR